MGQPKPKVSQGNPEDADMKYFTGYVWPQETKGVNDRPSLVLQQCHHEETGLAVALGVICKGTEKNRPDTAAGEHHTGARFARNCVNWYYDGCLSMRGNGAERSFQKMLGNLNTLLRDAPDALAGIYGMGENVVVFQKGSMGIYVVNERWNMAQVRPLFNASSQLQTLCVIPEPNTGILIASSQFYNSVSMAEMAACLRQRGIRAQEQVRQRIQELGNVVQEPGIFIVFRGDE